MSTTAPERPQKRDTVGRPGSGAVSRSGGASRRGLAVVATGTALWLLVAVVLHLTQGTSNVDAGVLWAWATGSDVPQTAQVFIDSRLPRLMAALLVGITLGASGAAMQSISRNPLASPDTTGVAAGAYFSLTLAATLGVSLGSYGGLAVAFLGGIVAAAAVIGLASGGTLSPVRLVLAGSVLTLGLGSMTSVLLLLFPWETQGLFVWGAGSLSQNGLDPVLAVAPIAVVALVAVLLLGRRLDLLQLGEDSAAALGVPVAATRRIVVVLAVILASTSVAIAGPIGFVGLCAPALMRLLRPSFPALRRQRVFIVLSGVCGVALVLSADVLLRALFGGVSGVTIPTGVVTSLLGAAFLIFLARRLHSSGEGESLITMRAGTVLGRRYPAVLMVGAAVLLAGVAVAGVLIGDRLILLGDVWNWVRGDAATVIDIVLGSRVPRVAGAVLAGACLALAGAFIQAVTRNPLADPGILGISASAGLGAVVVITTTGMAGAGIFAGAMLGAAVGSLIVMGAGRTDQLRLVLVGIGVSAGAVALTTLFIVGTDPWNQTLAITWLGGSTYGASFGELAPMALTLLIAIVVASRSARELDLLQFDETTPRVLGVAVGPQRLLHIALAVALTGVATASIGTIAFVGLVAPHAARMLIGKSHALLLPLTTLLGATLVVASDLVGRSVIAPAQLPAGLVVALIGTPYFLWLLHRMRADS